MNKIAQNFFEGLKAQLNNTASIGKFITEETFINGQPFSFEGHEYQPYIINLIETRPGATFSITKPSQVGLSEISYRIVLGKMGISPGTAVLLAMPSKIFSQEVLKTRVNSIITESPRLNSLIDRNVDSASTKMFHNNSILYALSGSKSSNSSLLNRPISVTLIDELDRMDMDIVTGFRSRMTHTPPARRLVIKISTPTAQGIGIDAEFDESRDQHVAEVVCEHCDYSFEPDYYEHVKIPGHDENLLLLTKAKAALLPISDAYLECPECKKPMETRATRWRVDENPLGMRNTIGIKLNPFIAPAFISIPDLVESSLTYKSHVEFLNQGLGRVANLSDSTIQRDHIHFEHRPQAAAQRIFGLDLGKLCYYIEGRLNFDTTMHIDELRVLKLSDLETFLEEKHKKVVFSAAVMDSQPYSDLVYRLVKKYPRLYSAIYVSPDTPIPELFKLKLTDKHSEIVRQVSINKSPMMDLMAGSLNSFLTIEPSPMEGTFIKHLLDMRRVRDYRFEEMIYQWIKSKQGEDHYFHALTYFFTAAKLAMADINDDFVMPVGIRKMKMKDPNQRR